MQSGRSNAGDIGSGSGLAASPSEPSYEPPTELGNDGTFNLAAGAPSVREIESFLDE